MSTMAADLRTSKSSGQPPMEAVVVNSIIYSKPSFCTLAIDLGDVPASTSDNKPTTSLKLKSGNCTNNGLIQNELDLRSTCWTNLSVPPPPPDAKVYRMCTIMNGSIHHQISDLCGDILAMAGLIGVAATNDHNDESLIDFGYKDGDNLGLGEILDDDDDEEDDDDEDEGDDYYDNYNLDDDVDDDDNDVVDFSYECPIEPALMLNCDKKKQVRFNTQPTVHYMHTWKYAYRAARKGEWEMYARDRERFKLRIQRAALILNPILEKEHRQKIFEKRFVNLYDNDKEKSTEYQQRNMAVNDVEDPAKNTMQHKETSTNESKKPHQKKKRRKRRFCKMGNKHYF